MITVISPEPTRVGMGVCKYLVDLYVLSHVGCIRLAKVFSVQERT